ncbi:hypothetical protein FTUN_6364 [Frigoriglobus tundricola]|uniref:Uncharacterized protein n=1 Tax=Frigoriglobus tundricola TaxID=2774151 RepID=A0A6M5YXN8_9BACT|nr:hypothetical protein FTUN_6364 [Frigoriglobus tundricola]
MRRVPCARSRARGHAGAGALAPANAGGRSERERGAPRGARTVTPRRRVARPPTRHRPRRRTWVRVSFASLWPLAATNGAPLTSTHRRFLFRPTE